jgi:LysR family transcriptional regulator, transcriptional activator of the cysJI operon
MDLKAMKMYCDAVTLHSFSLAAARNHVTQSAVSQAIQQIETELRIVLIDRSQRPFRLTPPGQEFYQGGQRILEMFDSVCQTTTMANADVIGIVNIAAIYSVGLALLLKLIECFESSHPHARVQVAYYHPDGVMAAVIAGNADFGILSYPPPHRFLTSLPWRSEPMVVACPLSDPFIRLRQILPRDLTGKAFIGFDPDLRIRKAIDRYLTVQHSHPTILMTFDNVDSIKQAVTEGVGVSILPSPALTREVEAGALAAVPLEPRLTRDLRIIHRSAKNLGLAARMFINYLCESVRTGHASCCNFPLPADNGTAIRTAAAGFLGIRA